MKNSKISIDIVSDVVCPWCLIGYKRLEKALEQFKDRDFEIRWHPFELNPDMPEAGQDLVEHMVEKYERTPEQISDSRQLMQAVGLTLGVEINHLRDSRIVNTFRAHQLLTWAATQGLQTELEMALFEAYFAHGRNLNDIEVLKITAGKVGLDPWEAEKVLKEERYRLETRQKEAMWLQRGVQVVPTFVINETFAMSGAQEPDYIKAVLDDLLGKGSI